jgi:hypothetical protein
VEVTDNAKTGHVSATYASQSSCPSSCPFRRRGCYAEYGPLGMTTTRLNASGEEDPEAIARQEAFAIDRLTGDHPLRLHVVGDCLSAGAARILAAAVARYRKRGPFRRKNHVWTYTHAWRKVARKAWGEVSVLASVENAADAAVAHRKGYAVAVVVPEFPTERAFPLEGTSLHVIPCPWQTRGVQCRDCRLCWDDQRLHKSGLCIGFTPHGQGKKAIAQTMKENP